MRGDYVTRPREQIAEVLRGTRRFLSAAEIHRVLEAESARVSLSTVYRTLDHLRAKHEVVERVDDAGESTFMICAPTQHHHHAICRLCGRVEDVDCASMDQFAESLKTELGFELDGHRMEFHGKCHTCR